jgi:hypothetical protein
MYCPRGGDSTVRIRWSSSRRASSSRRSSSSTQPFDPRRAWSGRPGRRSSRNTERAEGGMRARLRGTACEALHETLPQRREPPRFAADEDGFGRLHGSRNEVLNLGLADTMRPW